MKDKGVRIDPSVLVDVVGTCLKASMESVAVTLGQEIASNVPNGSEHSKRLQNAFAQAGVTTPSFMKPKEAPIIGLADIESLFADELPAELPAQLPVDSTESDRLGATVEAPAGRHEKAVLDL
jgi:hypothetical protein